MKKLFTIIGFEINSYLQNKSYRISTVLIIALVSIVMFLPSLFDMSSILGTPPKDTSREKEMSRDFAFYDKADMIKDMAVLEAAFPNVKWILCESEEEVKNKVNETEVESGFVVTGINTYEYYVLNKSIDDTDTYAFDLVMTAIYKQDYCEKNHMDYATFSAEYEAPIVSNENILGKDATSNYWYCYILVIGIFMIIMLYGVGIATAVTNEKSNRCIEVLITSVNADALLFGKVIAGAFMSLVQVWLILRITIAVYHLNQEAWGNMLDMFLEIPSDVLVAFAFFGLGGFVFYAFMYGAMGALVSKTEDINKTAGSVQGIIMLVYFAVLLQMHNPDGMVMKVLSYLPVSSYTAMFIRISMGSVATWEIVISFVILVVSIIGVGFVGAGIYRMGTLRYGNPIKITNAIKYLKHS